jgi:hypothetical protein
MSAAVRKFKPNAVMTPETMHAIMDEVEEYYQRYKRVRDKLRRQKPGSEAYLDTLPHAWVALATLGTKVESATLAIDEFEDALPDKPGRAERTTMAEENPAQLGRRGSGTQAPGSQLVRSGLQGGHSNERQSETVKAASNSHSRARC